MAKQAQLKRAPSVEMLKYVQEKLNKDLENYYDKLSLAPLPIIRLFPDMKNDKFYLSMLKDQYF